MSENASTTNVVSGEGSSQKKDKYLKDISDSFPKITLCVPQVNNKVNNKDFIKVEVNDVIAGKTETDRIEIGADTIEREGDVGIPAQTCKNVDEYNKIKATLKARGAKSVADRRAKGEEIEQAVLILNPDALTQEDGKLTSQELDEK